MDFWSDYPDADSTLTTHLASQVCYLYEYVQPLKEWSFAEQLKYEHRQFHFDTIAGMQWVPFHFDGTKEPFGMQY